MGDIVKQIFDTQQILDDVLDDNPKPSKADNVLIQQLMAQLVELKTSLHESCQTSTECDIKPLKLFPKNENIFRSKRCRSKQQSPLKPIENIHVKVNNDSNKPKSRKFHAIRNELSILRKSFSQRRRNAKKLRLSIRSSPKLCASLRSSINQVNDTDTDCSSSINLHSERPMTARSYFDNQTQSHSPPSNGYKRTYLKRKRTKLKFQKVDWSHVRAKTVCRHDNIRTNRLSNSQRVYSKQPKINWKEKVSSRVDCKWSSDKYGYRPPAAKTKQPKRKRKKQKEFVETFHHSNHRKKSNHQSEDDKYLYYFKKNGVKVGRISRDETLAQLQSGNGSMILQTKQNEFDASEDTEDSNVRIIITNNDMEDDESESNKQLNELQQTFAAIEHAMKQKRQHTHL